MSKSAIDAEINNQIFRKNFGAIIAIRRDLAQISPVRLYNDGAAYYMGQCLARNTGTGEFQRWSTVSGGSYDSPCVLFEDVLTYQFESAVTGGALARGLMECAGAFKSKLINYDANWKSAAVAKEITDATGLTVVKF